MLRRLSKKLGLDKAVHFLIRKHPKWSIAFLFLAFTLIIILGYLFKWDWTGLNAHIGPNVQQYQPGKTLWDWMSVLCIPVAIAFGSLWFTAQQSKTQDAENEDNQHERALQEYIDKISDLLLNHNLRESVPVLSIDHQFTLKGTETKPSEEVRTIARARTLTVLARLDGDRKRSVLKFLHESGLIRKKPSVISLKGADLAKTHLTFANFVGDDLSGADLSSSNLSYAILYGTWLSFANLDGAHLRGAHLTHSNLSCANLSCANLRDAILRDAILRDAILNSTDLDGAKLDGADLTSVSGVTSEQLARAKSLKGTTMPDGSSIEKPGDPDSFASQVLALWKKQGR